MKLLMKMRNEHAAAKSCPLVKVTLLQELERLYYNEMIRFFPY